MGLPLELPIILGGDLDVVCWSEGTAESPLTSFDTTIAQRDLFITRGFGFEIENLRLYLLQSVVSGHSDVRSARVVIQLAADPELSTIVAPIMPLPEHVFKANVCGRKTLVEIATQMEQHQQLLDPSLRAVQAYAGLPAPYADLIGVKLRSKSPKSRVCAMAALVCVGAFNV